VTRSGSGKKTGIVTHLARIFLTLGALLLSFVAYQLWGTGLFEHQAQNHLRSQLEARLGHPAATPTRATTGAPPASAQAGGTDNSVIQSPTALAASAHAPPAGSPLAYLSIPRLGMSNSVIVEGVGEQQLQEGPGHYPGTALPGQPNNIAIAGHRTTYGAPFYNLDQLQPGDPITIQVPQGIFRYAVMKSMIVNPNDVAVLDPEPLPVLTLTTCNPRYSAANRLVVVALLQGAQAAPGVANDPPATVTAATTPATTPKKHETLRLTPAETTGSIGGAITWGLVALMAYLMVLLLWRRRQRPLRWGALILGIPGVMLALFVFFEHVSLVLPSSF
jgi:sortase A